MTQIPGPPGLPIVGNINDLDSNDASKSFVRLADQYGDIFRINLLGRSVVVVNTQELANEICDEKRFHKVPSGALKEVRNGVGDGLFTAFETEENWHLAHRILMPSFGPIAIRNMYEEMHEIAAQMVSRWAREGPHKSIDPTEDFTKIALDSIALAAMSTRFNSFYRYVTKTVMPSMRLVLTA
jgi:cytochrome P450/NADPH-cytochrome P450 reductase